MKTIQNKLVSLSVDNKGRLVSLKNKSTGAELIAYRRMAEAWRMIIPSGRMTIDFLYGSTQKPKAITILKTQKGSALTIAYDSLSTEKEKLPIVAKFIFELNTDEPTIRARVEIKNRSKRRIDEVEFPVIGGLGGFGAKDTGREINLMYFSSTQHLALFEGDILNNVLPDTGRVADQFVREHSTAMLNDDKTGCLGADFYGTDEGLYVGYNSKTPQEFCLKLERYPKQSQPPYTAPQDYPKETKKWIRVWGLHVPELAPGANWTSEPVTFFAHKGDWHTAAKWYRNNVPVFGKFAQPPQWMDDFLGWNSIVGKLNTGEVFHDFKTCAKNIIADAKVTGLDCVFYYGHTNLGAEGADYDYSPAEDLGGKQEFIKMVNKLHNAGIRIILLDHLHRYVNADIPEYKKHNLERYASIDSQGKRREARWWKETYLSCHHLRGNTPVWVEMCPLCKQWQEHYRKEILKLIDLGIDGIEMDCFFSTVCFSKNHGHEPGINVMSKKLEWLKNLRLEIKSINPDFLIVCETMEPRVREFADAFFPNRFADENGRGHRFLFPELRQQTVRVMNHAYDSVNKALQFGIGLDMEIWGVRKTTLAGCPELARYVAKINRLKRQYPHLLCRGMFRDTLGATVKGDIFHSVLEADNGDRALVLRNQHPEPKKISANFIEPNPAARRFLATIDSEKPRQLHRAPLSLVMPARSVAVMLEIRQ